MTAEPVSTSFLSYIEDQFSFIKSLSPNITDKIIVRLHRSDYGWCLKMRFHERFPNICIDDSNSDLIGRMCESKIVVSTYNGTSFLQSMALNIPTVIFWNPQQCELRDDAIPIFKALEGAGIFHQTPEDAAKHIASIWWSVDHWWNSADVQSTRQLFCRNYAHIPDGLDDQFSGILKKIANTSLDETY